MDTSILTPEDVVTFQLRTRGFSLITKPGISLEADARARIASQTEAHFMLGRVAAPRPEPEDKYAEEWDFRDAFGGPTFSYTEPCRACGEVHPC